MPNATSRMPKKIPQVVRLLISLETFCPRLDDVDMRCSFLRPLVDAHALSSRRGGARIVCLDCEASEMGPHPADVHHHAPGKSTVGLSSRPELTVGQHFRLTTEARRKQWPQIHADER